MVVGPIDAAGQFDEACAKVTARFELADLIFDVPQGSVDRFQLRCMGVISGVSSRSCERAQHRELDSNVTKFLESGVVAL